PAGLTPYLGTCRLVVGHGIRRVHILVRHVRVRRLSGQSFCHSNVVVGRVGRYVCRRHDHLCTVCSEKASLLLAHLVGHCKDHLVALDTRDHSKACPAVSRGRFDDCSPRLQETLLLCVLEHCYSNRVVHATSRVQILQLCH